MQLIFNIGVDKEAMSWRTAHNDGMVGGGVRVAPVAC